MGYVPLLSLSDLLLFAFLLCRDGGITNTSRAVSRYLSLLQRVSGGLALNALSSMSFRRLVTHIHPHTIMALAVSDNPLAERHTIAFRQVLICYSPPEGVA